MTAFLAKTNVDEIKDLLGLISGLYTALDQLFLNGRKPIVKVRKFELAPKSRSDARSPGELVYSQGHEVLRMVSVPDRDEQRYNAGY